MTDDQSSQVKDWRNRVPKMMHWLDVMCHPDGEIAFFNDAAIGIAPNKRELADYARRLDIEVVSTVRRLVWLKSSGYVRLTNGLATVIADVARVGPDYLPGHAHADTLSFEFSLGLRRIIVNSGTSVYGVGLERLYQRSTAAHSTLVVDQRDSSEVWGGFRVARRARPFDVNVHNEGAMLALQAAHDGYARLLGSPIHRRRWVLEEGSVRIIDEVTGVGWHRADILFHLAPGVVPHKLSSGEVMLSGHHLHAGPVVCRSTAASVAIEQSTWHPEFGVSEENFRLCITLIGNLPLKHEMIFCWESS